MLMGLQGSGKTTTTSKLANYLKNKKKKFKNILLVSLDIYRPAAIDQLEKLPKERSVFPSFLYTVTFTSELVVVTGHSSSQKPIISASWI